MSKAFGYIRVSHIDQADKGNSIDTQRKVVEDKYQQLRRVEPDLEWGELIPDEAQSAYRKKFVQRPGGCRLNGMVRKGDIIIFPRVDRAFRNLMDMWKMVEHWKEMGVRFVFCDAPFEPGTPMGDMFLSLLGTFAQFDSAMKSERIKAGIANRKQNGYVHGITPTGFARVRSNSLGHDVLVETPVFQELADKVNEYRQKGMGFDSISDEIEDYVAARDGRKSRRGVRSRYEYGKKVLRSIWQKAQQRDTQAVDSVAPSDR